MRTIPQIDLWVLPENAQQEVYDFYLFLKQRYHLKQSSDHLKKQQKQNVDKLNPLKVDSFTPLSRDDIYDR